MYYVGLDLGATSAHFAVTSDGVTFTHEGEITLERLPVLLDDLGTISEAAFGMEWTGRLAAPWIAALRDMVIPAYIIHTNNRRALTVLAGQAAKTDKHDARITARTLRLWHDRAFRQALNLSPDLFTNAAVVQHAWTLRGLLYDQLAHTRVRVAAQNRVTAARRIGSPERIALWEEYAGNGYSDLAGRLAQEHARQFFQLEIAALQSIPGIGIQTALWITAVLCPVARFHEVTEKGDRTEANVLRYVGLYPKREQSGLMDKHNKPAKRGNSHLRGALNFAAVAAAHPARHDCYARLYVRLRAEGRPAHEIHCRVASALLRCALSVLRSLRPYQDRHPHLLPPVPEKAVKPPHLLTQADCARLACCTRQGISVAVKAGKLPQVEHEGKYFVTEAAFVDWHESRLQKPAAGRRRAVASCLPPEINQEYAVREG